VTRRLARLTTHRVSLAPRRPHRWHGLTEQIGGYVLVELEDDDGLTGWGEAPALGSWGGDHGAHDGETPAGVEHVLHDLVAPRVLGSATDDRHAMLAAASGTVRGHPYAMTAFEGALLDLVARRFGVPVFELLGGRRRAAVPVAHSIGLLEDDEVLAEADAVAATGVRTVKLKAGEDPERDVRLIRRVAEVLDGRAALAVDANQGWGTATDAERVLRRVADVPLRYVEQPVEGARQLALLAPRVPFPLMADESAWTPQEVFELARTDACRLVSIYTTKPGGLHRALAIDAVAHAAGIGTNVNGSGETGIGNLANLHLAAVMSSLAEDCVVPVSRRREDQDGSIAGVMYADDVIRRSLGLVDGAIAVPTGPGWGVDVDAERVAEHTVGTRTTTAAR
jgi:muconate cycloisomerase